MGLGVLKNREILGNNPNYHNINILKEKQLYEVFQMGLEYLQ